MYRVRYRPKDEPWVIGWSHVYASLAEVVQVARRLEADNCRVVIEVEGERDALTLEEAEACLKAEG